MQFDRALRKGNHQQKLNSKEPHRNAEASTWTAIPTQCTSNSQAHHATTNNSNVEHIRCSLHPTDLVSMILHVHWENHYRHCRNLHKISIPHNQKLQSLNLTPQPKYAEKGGSEYLRTGRRIQARSRRIVESPDQWLDPTRRRKTSVRERTLRSGDEPGRDGITKRWKRKEGGDRNGSR